MGLVRKSTADEVAAEDVAAGGSGPDMSTIIRRAVAAEIQRQRLENEQRDAAPDARGTV